MEGRGILRERALWRGRERVASRCDLGIGVGKAHGGGGVKSGNSQRCDVGWCTAKEPILMLLMGLG